MCVRKMAQLLTFVLFSGLFALMGCHPTQAHTLHLVTHFRHDGKRDLSTNVTGYSIGKRVADKILEYQNVFLMWNYGGALIFDGLYELKEAFQLNYETIIDEYLNLFIDDPKHYGYKIIHGINISYDETIGDDVGLFPIAYLNRIESDEQRVEDLQIVLNVVIRNLFWPVRLADDTIARDVGWRGLRGKFVWADDQYMGLILLARFAREHYKRHIAEFVFSQTILFTKHLRDKHDGLYFHGYSNDNNSTSCCKWGRANGWIILSFVEVLSMIERYPSLESEKEDVVEQLQMLAMALLKYQSDDGRFHQVINETWTYLETSCTAMIVTSLGRGVRHGYLERSIYDAAIWRAWHGLQTTIDDDGTVRGICMPTDIQENVDDYASRPSLYLLSGNGGLGAVLQAAVEIHKYQQYIEQL